MKNELPKWLMAILGFAGFTSCEIGATMYGCPTVDYNVAAQVRNEQGEGIGDIKVSLVRNLPELPQPDTVAIGLTDASGYCLIKHSDTGFGSPETFIIGFDDIDGEARGGKYKSTHIVHTFEEFKGGDGSWYNGFSTVYPEVTLKKEK
ncbi:MAG: radical SAM-associated putative lipoprotein [Tidjanibacter sp.]|nr:radical SAM-associated putative lipoprotein [Tidjanibacter sp.]